MNAQNKRYALIAAILVIALIFGLGARFLFDDSLRQTVSTGPVHGEDGGSAATGTKQAATPSERADAAIEAASRILPKADEAKSEEKSAISGPSFDVVRVEPDGSAVIAGRASPGAEVELVAGDRVIARVTAGPGGEFVITPDPLKPGGHELILRERGSGEISQRAVVVSVPASRNGEVLVVAGEPGKPSAVLQAGGGDAPPVAESGASSGAEAGGTGDALRITSVEAEKGRLYVQGTGPNGARAAIYLNETAIADAVVGNDGKWSLTVEKGVTPGAYTVRVDQVGDDGQVVARAAVPFEFAAGTAMADAPRTAMASSANDAPAAPETASADIAHATGSGPDSGMGITGKNGELGGLPGETPGSGEEVAANPVVAEIGTVSVRRGDNLWRISRATYGRGMRYTVIYEANSTQIRDPDLIYPGQVFVLPPRT